MATIALHVMPLYVKNWWRIFLILLIATFFRVAYLDYTPGPGSFDIFWYATWTQTAVQRGLFGVYVQGWPNYPPVYVSILASLGIIESIRGVPPPYTLYSPGMMTLLKLAPILADILIIGIVAVWLRHKPIVRWLVPGLLAISPGLLIVSTWRGQSDSVVTLFMVLALIALSRDHPRQSWAFAALAALTKPQALFLGPLLLVLTYRRYGWRECVRCLGIFVGIHIIIFLPFVLGSGLDNVVLMYTWHTSHNVELTAHALNFWFLVSPTYPILPTDSLAIWGPLTARYAGDILFGVVVLLVIVHAWRNSQKRYEFVWASVLMLGFFVFFTGVYERYLYYAAVLLPIAMAQEPQLWGAALSVTYIFALNNITLWTGKAYSYLGDWFGWFLWWEKFYWLAAALNVALVFESLRILNSGKGLYRWFFRLTRVAAVSIAALLIIAIIHDPIGYTPTANWLANNVAKRELIATENVEVSRFARDLYPVAASWGWRPTSRIEDQGLPYLRSAGIRYAVLDERTRPNEDFGTRINLLVAQGATLLHESSGLLSPGSREAVLWTFRPRQQTDLIVDDSLRMLGYDLIHGDLTDSIVLYWYVERVPQVDFHLYLHLFEPGTENVLGIYDTILGKAIHPTSKWYLHEVFSERDPLPVRIGDKPIRLEIGLYDFSTGDRAMFKDSAGENQADHNDIMIKPTGANPSELFEF